MSVFKAYTAYYYFDNFISKLKGNLLLAVILLLTCIFSFVAYLFFYRLFN